MSRPVEKWASSAGRNVGDLDGFAAGGAEVSPYGVQIGRDTISNVTDAVLADGVDPVGVVGRAAGIDWSS